METEKTLKGLNKTELIEIIRGYEEKLLVIEECSDLLRRDSM